MSKALFSSEFCFPISPHFINRSSVYICTYNPVPKLYISSGNLKHPFLEPRPTYRCLRFVLDPNTQKIKHIFTAPHQHAKDKTRPYLKTVH